MKGLFLDSIYKTMDSIKLLILVLFVIGVGIIGFVDSQFILQAFISSIFLSISVSALISVRKDISSKWYKYEISLPENVVFLNDKVFKGGILSDDLLLRSSLLLFNDLRILLNYCCHY